MSVNDPSTWAPPGETSADLWEERSNFNGLVLSCVAYGVHFTLYLIVLQHLLKHPTHRVGSGGKAKISWGLVLYITWNFILGTFGLAGGARFNQLTFIDARNYPGGPNAFVAEQYGDFVNIFGTVALVILQWFADGMVIYRFWLIYNFNYFVAILPCLLLLASFSMGVLLLFQLTQPFANLWTKTTLNFGIPYWSISAGLNILVTSLIVARLFAIRRRTKAVLSASHSKTYTSIAAMLVESAALYSITALIFIVTYARNSNVQNLILPLLGQVQAISPLLIMWRVACGQAISRDSLPSTAPSVSKISWRHSRATGMGSASNASRTLAGTSVAAGKSQTQSVNLPTFPKSQKYTFASDMSGMSGKSETFDDGDWELSERKVPGVEVVVQHQVEHWADDRNAGAQVSRGNTL